MVLLLVDQADQKQLIVIFTESSKAPPELKVRDAGPVPLKFKRIKNGNKMILSGEHWWKLRSTYAIEDGYRITIESISNNDYKIVEVWKP
ncbi:hypothetical protein GOBAR_AA04171 [Gossypium barbadense]|uniref:TF-B3 domain-containing protein n=1 Tax=Gossypium barbadense TaxID=3634 RepID=A0A2P5YL69_GOSBA|nr:hypothetical protein GOBAR_AA04171 [Gossypium barbadense]